MLALAMPFLSLRNISTQQLKIAMHSFLRERVTTVTLFKTNISASSMMMSCTLLEHKILAQRRPVHIIGLSIKC